MEFGDAVSGRRMTRSFLTREVDPDVIEKIVDLAARAPSAGKTQGWHLLVLQGEQVAKFWNQTFDAQHRESFRWPQLFSAPVIAVAFADPEAYVARYSEADKAATGLGAGTDAWPTPYWTVDAAFSVMTMLLAIEDAGLGALFFAVFNGADQLRREFKVPDNLQLIGAIALGWASRESAGDVPGGDSRSGASASRDRRHAREIIHYQMW